MGVAEYDKRRGEWGKWVWRNMTNGVANGANGRCEKGRHAGLPLHTALAVTSMADFATIVANGRPQGSPLHFVAITLLGGVAIWVCRGNPCVPVAQLG